MLKSDFNREIRICVICELPMRSSWNTRKVKKKTKEGYEYLGDEYIHKHCENKKGWSYKINTK